MFIVNAFSLNKQKFLVPINTPHRAYWNMFVNPPWKCFLISLSFSRSHAAIKLTTSKESLLAG